MKGKYDLLLRKYHTRETMLFLVVGYGSMGKRRVRLTMELLPDARFVCVDSKVYRQEEAKKSGHLIFESIQEAVEKNSFDAAFVCTSPGSHADIVLRLIDKNIPVFCELNLITNKYYEIKLLANQKNVPIFVSSTLLYKRQMVLLKQLVSEQKRPLTYVYHVGQYLPDWHPWESYKDFFVGNKQTNGVREIYAIQLPWIVDCFGEIDSFSSLSTRSTGLDIDFPDSLISVFNHKNGNIGVFVADVVSRKAVARLEVTGESLHVFWDGHNDDFYLYDIEKRQMNQIQVYDTIEHLEGYSDIITEQPYREELIDFFRYIKGESKPRYSLEDDEKILKLIDKIEGIE